jgi:tetratricopeptide (TPR) repeat protein
MADEKDKDAAHEDLALVGGKPIDELNLEEVADALDKGEIELPRQVEPQPDELFTLERFEKFIIGEMTWAQLNGMTMDEAYHIAEYGYSLFSQGRYHDAKTIFDALVIANPYDAYFHTMLGAVYQQLDMLEEAELEYSTAVELDVENLQAWVNRGELRLNRGDIKQALEDLGQAINLDPTGEQEAGSRALALGKAAALALDSIQKLAQNTDETKP